MSPAPDGLRCASGDRNGKLLLWEVASKTVLHTLKWVEEWVSFVCGAFRG